MIERYRQGAVEVVTFQGAMCGDGLAELTETLAELMRRGQPATVLDLQQTTLIDSAGLELLQEMQAGYHWQGGSLKLAGVNELCGEILAITGVGQQLQQYPDVAAAVGSF